jgi:hypothetical protein
MRPAISHDGDSHHVAKAGRQACRAAPRRARVPPVPHARQGRHRRHQAADQPARPGAGLFPWRGRAVRRNRRRPQQRLQVHQPGQPGGGHHQRHGGAGPGRHRPAGGQAGDGRQRRAVQEVRRHRCVRHRDQRKRPGQAGRDHRRAGADLWRHQPGRHQGAGLLLCRAQAARTHEDSGLPRRPARHRHRGGRGHLQRPEGGGQRPETGQAGHLRRGSRRPGLPGPAGQAGHSARKHLGDRPGRCGLRGPHRTDGPGQDPVRPNHRRAHPGRSH